MLCLYIKEPSKYRRGNSQLTSLSLTQTLNVVWIHFLVKTGVSNVAFRIFHPFYLRVFRCCFSRRNEGIVPYVTQLSAIVMWQLEGGVRCVQLFFSFVLFLFVSRMWIICYKPAKNCTTARISYLCWSTCCQLETFSTLVATEAAPMGLNFSRYRR